MAETEAFDPSEEIAIIGLAGRFPGAANTDQFWQNLRDGVESISFFSEQELESNYIDPTLLKSPNYVRANAVLDGGDLFDAVFFGFSPREAEIMDPQQRLLLESAWEALENAGYDPESYQGLIGLYAGQSMNTYLFNLYANDDVRKSLDDFQIGLGNDKDFLTTRVAYKLNLKGPCMTVQTACSTSLVAVHLACQSLLDGQCDMALAGGVSLRIPQRAGYLYQQGGISSPDGHCRAFDAQAAGCVGGSGVGLVVLKRLADALADRDNIHAVIKGSAVNNDGSLKMGYTAPSIEGQAAVIAEALAMARISPEQVTYVEAHGTGTALGDPVEVAALTQSFRRGTDSCGYCAIGTVKTNIGHLDAAAGIAGLIKTVLALKNRMIPPSLHFETPNAQIDFARSPFYVNANLREWNGNGGPLCAGVSSFGIGGTNAHVILAEAPTNDSRQSSRPWHTLVLSAKSGAALEGATAQLRETLLQHPHVDLADVAYTLQVGRKSFAYRRAFVCRDSKDAVAALLDPKRALHANEPAKRRDVAFMFPGQGTQRPEMGEELYDHEPVYKEWVDRCAELLQSASGFDLRQTLYPKGAGKDRTNDEAVAQTAVAQPALFAVEYSLAQMWIARGVCACAMIGHSIGEYVAAALAGVFSLEDALRLVTTRGRLMQQCVTGSMLAIEMDESAARSRMAGTNLSLAAVNAPGRCVVSGANDAIFALERRLKDEGIFTKRLRTSHAFHSELMRPIVDSFVAEVRQVQLNAPAIPFLSNVTGDWIKNDEATDPKYWGRHLLETVRFGDGMTTLLKSEDVVLLEVGPGRTLSTFAKQQNDERRPLVVATLSIPGQHESDEVSLQKAMGQLWAAGVPVNWQQCHGQEMPRRVELPTYPFERQRYWIERGNQFLAANKVQSHSRRLEIDDWFYVPVWKQSISRAAVSNVKTDKTASYLILLDRFGIGAELVAALRRNSVRVIGAEAGDEMKRLGADCYSFNAERVEDYRELFSAAGSVLPEIVDLRHLDSHDGSGLTIQADYNHLWDGFNGLLLLAQALGDAMMDRTEETMALFRVLVVTNSLHAVTGTEQLQPLKATILGPCKVLPLEYPGASCANVDVVLPTTGGRAREVLINQLLNEILTPCDDWCVAFRGPYRWVRAFEPVRLRGTDGIAPRLRKRGTYLITGGLGGLGLEIAAYLSHKAQARLVLMGRRSFPPREDWDKWLATHDETDEISVKLRKLEAIEKNASECLLLSGDVTRRSDIERVLAETTTRFGRIHGVIHAAGIAGEGVMQFKNREQTESVLAPKVQGSLWLAELLKDSPLDFLIFCSSLRTIQGGVGLADYCAANAFLDAFAHYQHVAGGTFTTAINWPGWQEVGMSVDAVKRRGLDPAESLRDGLAPDEGTQALDRILQTSLPQVIISPRDLQQVLAESGPTVDHALGKQPVNRESAQITHQRPQLDNPYRPPASDTERTLAKIWQEALGVAQIGLDDNFFELGGDSIISLRIASRAAQTGIQLTARDVFECRTIADLAARASHVQTPATTQEMLTGKVELTPVQHWFFEQHFPEPAHYNQSVMLELPADIDASLLKSAWQQVLTHHDALRLRFVKTSGEWEQSIHGPIDQTTFHHIDLSALATPDQREQLKAAASRLQTSLNLEGGPLCRAVYIKRGTPNSARLLLIIHHLAVDAVSWRILIETLQQATRALSEHRKLHLPAKTTSFQEWSRRLLNLAQTAEIEIDAPYWLAQLEQRPTMLPVDYLNGNNLVASETALSVSLSTAETVSLIHQTTLAYQVQIDDVLLAALAHALAQCTSEGSLLADVEGHGREPMAGDLDVSCTVGWFTNIYPLRLELNRSTRIAAVLTSVKERRRQLPHRGISYGLLRYLNNSGAWRERFHAAPRAQLRFLYLGQLDQELTELGFFRLADEVIGPAQNLLGQRPYLLDINCYIRDGHFQASWSYSQKLHKRTTIERFAGRFISSLQLLIAEAAAPRSQYKSSDFPIADLSQDELDELVTSLAKTTT